MGEDSGKGSKGTRARIGWMASTYLFQYQYWTPRNVEKGKRNGYCCETNYYLEKNLSITIRLATKIIGTSC